MQVKHFDGSFGPVEPFDGNELKKRLAQPNVQHVEVFDGTPQEIERRTNLSLRVHKRFQKTGKNKKP